MSSIKEQAKTLRKSAIKKLLPEWVVDPVIWEEDRKKGDRVQVRFKCSCKRTKVQTLVRAGEITEASKVGELLAAQVVVEHGTCQSCIETEASEVNTHPYRPRNASLLSMVRLLSLMLRQCWLKKKSL